MKKGMLARSLFLVVGIMFISLASISFISAGFGQETSQVFNLGGWWCDNGIWKNPGNDTTPSSFLIGNCSKYASENNNVGCCSGNQECNRDGSCSGWIKYCRDYSNQYSCDMGLPKVGYMNNVDYLCDASSAIVDQDGCVTTYYCKCKWDTATSKCMNVLDIITAPIPPSAPSCTTSGGVSSCIWTSSVVENHCNDSLNYILVERKASWLGSESTRPEGCKDVTREDTCPITTKLPFFGNFMMFISICLIIMIYFFKDITEKKKFSYP